MKRIHIIVSASEMPAVREAAFIAGADKLVITRIAYRTAIGGLEGGYCKTFVSAREIIREWKSPRTTAALTALSPSCFRSHTAQRSKVSVGLKGSNLET